MGRARVRDARAMERAAPSVGRPGPSFAHARVGDAMSSRVLSCDPATSLVTVAQRMTGEGVHAVVVLRGPGDPGQLPSGLITDTVVLRHAEAADCFTAGEVADRDVLEVFPDEPLASVAKRMARHGVTHAVVLDGLGGHLIGVLASSDVVRVIAWGSH